MSNGAAPEGLLQAGTAGAWPELSQLLDEALALADPERGPWLASLPVTPAKAALVRLLGHQAQVESANFLGTLPRLSPAALASIGDEGGGAAAALAPQPGSEVGPWRLLRELGQGGMGAVWLAERADGSLKRQVALKLPNRSWDAALAQRMLQERDILATLTHPHIARLYDAGFDAQGRPFLALEYVDGRPINEHVRAGALGVKPILALLLQVAAAVAHAHSRLVIHRDLKPGNILVDAQGQVHLLDFGIAKLMEGERTAETALTRAAGRVLTLEYASPEQVRGEPLGTASDVYSLAVVAYELLAGSRPYTLKRGSAAELEEAIARGDPPLASEAATGAAARASVSRALRGDLDAILNKALKKRPEERYAGVAALAEDLQRHLDGQAVLARPDSRWYVARKFAARHRVPVVAAAAVFAALGIGLSVALWQAASARESLRLSTMALEREAGVRRLFVETLAGVAAWDAKTFAEPQSVSRLLQSQLAALEQTFRDEPYQRIALLNVVADQLPYFGDYEGSLALWQRYLPLVKAQGGDAQQLLQGYIGITRALYFLQRFPEREAMAREGLAATATAAGVAETRAEVAYELADALQRRGARAAASALLDEHEGALALAENPKHKVRWDIQLMRARMAFNHDDFEALRWARQAQAGYASNTDSSVSQLGMSAQYVGLAQAALGQAALAEAAFKTGLQHYEKVFSREDRDTVQALSRVAGSAAAQGRYAEAQQMLAERQRLVEAKPGPDTPLALRMLLLGQLETALWHGDLEAAGRLAPPVRASHVPLTDERARGPAVAATARWHLLAGRAQPAAQGLADWVDKLPPAHANSPAAQRARLLWAEAEAALGHLSRARSLLQEATQGLRGSGATRTWSYRLALELSAWLDATGVGGAGGPSADQAASALAAAEQAVQAAGIESIEPPSMVDRAESLRRRAQVLRAAGRAAQADALEPALREALQGQHAASPRWAWLAGKP